MNFDSKAPSPSSTPWTTNAGFTDSICCRWSIVGAGAGAGGQLGKVGNSELFNEMVTIAQNEL